jgi:hypothetical protein
MAWRVSLRALNATLLTRGPVPLVFSKCVAVARVRMLPPQPPPGAGVSAVRPCGRRRDRRGPRGRRRPFIERRAHVRLFDVLHRIVHRRPVQIQLGKGKRELETFAKQKPRSYREHGGIRISVNSRLFAVSLFVLIRVHQWFIILK